jgi:ribosomal protein S18 acetylase RimI-like enzyme
MVFLLAQRPQKVIQILEVMRLTKGVKTESKNEGTILSFGVIHEYRNRSFIDTTGTFIAHELFQHTFHFFRKANISRLRMLVEPENKEALLFYHTYGCKFEKIDMMGKSLVQVTHTIQ